MHLDSDTPHHAWVIVKGQWQGPQITFEGVRVVKGDAAFQAQYTGVLRAGALTGTWKKGDIEGPFELAPKP
jgi:hypothetical protein